MRKEGSSPPRRWRLCPPSKLCAYGKSLSTADTAFSVAVPEGGRTVDQPVGMVNLHGAVDDAPVVIVLERLADLGGYLEALVDGEPVARGLLSTMSWT